MSDETNEERLERIRAEMAGKTTYELMEELKRFAEAMRQLRIFIYFQQDLIDAPIDAKGVSQPAKITFGPYCAAEIVDGVLYVDGDVDDESFVLATQNEAGSWDVHDGSEGVGAVYKRLRFHTYPPRHATEEGR
jgi:hypothetical protein